MVATVGDDAEPVLVGMRDYPVRKLIMLHTDSSRATAQSIADKVRPILVDVELRELDEGDLLMDTLANVREIQATQAAGFSDMIINVAGGEKMQTCCALSAAFVHGVPAIGVGATGPFPLPVLKFSYDEMVSDAKMHILATLQREGGMMDSLADLSRSSGVEKSLLSYHLRTTREGKGLEDMGLVRIDRDAGRLSIEISEMGRLLLIGRTDG